MAATHLITHKMATAHPLYQNGRRALAITKWTPRTCYDVDQYGRRAPVVA